MKWTAFKIVQLCCWLASIIIIILSLADKKYFKDPEEVLELLGLLSAASLALNELYERWLEKFSAANVLAIGYFKNCIEPIMENQYKQLSENKNSFVLKTIYIFMPETIAAVNSSIIYANIAKANLDRKKVTVAVEMRNRNVMDINEITSPSANKIYYFDVPNTLSSLEALIDYKLAKKANSSSEAQKEKLEKKYLFMFHYQMEKMIKEKGMNDDVKLIDAIGKLP